MGHGEADAARSASDEDVAVLDGDFGGARAGDEAEEDEEKERGGEDEEREVRQIYVRHG